MKDTVLQIIVNLLGIIGIAGSIASFQCKKHKGVMMLRTMNETAFAIQYILLGAYTGAAMNIVGSTRNLIFASQVKRGKSTVISRIVFSVLFLVMGVCTWQGPKSFIIIGAKLLTTLAYGMKSVRAIRLLSLVSCLCWLTYNIVVGSWTGATNEMLTIASIIAGIIRYDIGKEKEKNES